MCILKLSFYVLLFGGKVGIRIYLIICTLGVKTYKKNKKKQYEINYYHHDHHYQHSCRVILLLGFRDKLNSYALGNVVRTQVLCNHSTFICRCILFHFLYCNTHLLLTINIFPPLVKCVESILILEGRNPNKLL